ncbi:MAG: hypothetical protein OZ927_18935 [Alcaligenaceae bacterium]|nr:hypothetical protein [Alcaligenaceae bacterium]
MQVEISLSDSVTMDEVLRLYRANEWSSAEKPQQLMAALRGSHALVTARILTFDQDCVVVAAAEFVWDELQDVRKNPDAMPGCRTSAI